MGRMQEPLEEYDEDVCKRVERALEQSHSNGEILFGCETGGITPVHRVAPFPGPSL